ncbi:hypothetical protein [Novosphingobium profundi]|uniref:hypothetical protein n=1 Tax=Novosphingobium profundi TaxID=1774954 RepID=UPI001CFE2111|nr:hypothetical protein [Novosphingobium profundi]
MPNTELNYDDYYRVWLHTLRPDCIFYDTGEDIPYGVDCARLRRQKNSHRGIGHRTGLSVLEAQNVNQEFLEEISALGNLNYLELGYAVTAFDLTPLTTLSELRILKINSPRNIVDFTPLLALPKLERLFIENAKHMTDLEWLGPLASQLTVLGIEGSMDTSKLIPSLTPLSGFSLEALFLTSTKLGDQNLLTLQSIRNLKILSTALNAPRKEFEALHRARPDLICSWFDPESWENRRGPRPIRR